MPCQQGVATSDKLSARRGHTSRFAPYRQDSLRSSAPSVPSAECVDGPSPPSERRPHAPGDTPIHSSRPLPSGARHPPPAHLYDRSTAIEEVQNVASEP